MKTKIKETTGHKIRRIRESKGLQQQECALRIGWQFQNWWKYETDRMKNPQTETLLKIAKALNVSYKHILSDYS